MLPNHTQFGRRCFILGALLLPWAVTMTGCHHGPAMAHVKGKVLYKDGSVPQGGVRTVNFQPTGESTAEVRKGAGGTIGPDGSFEMWTKRPGDGVYLGEYRVSFAVWPGPMDARSLIALKYTSPHTSGYTVNVTDDIDDLKFEIEPLPGAGGRAATGATPAKPAG